MTETKVQAPEWVSLAERRPKLAAYEVNHRGRVRSVDRMDRLGRKVKGCELKPRVSGTSVYPKVTLYDADGKQTDFTVGSLVLLAYVGECPEGQEVMHLHDNPLDNRWPEELSYGTHEQNVFQRTINRPALPKPIKVCVRCGAEFTSSGKRCHDCVVQVGQLAARKLAEGADLEQVADDLGYPSHVGVFRLAVRYGGAVVVLATDLQEVNEQLRHQSWLHNVFVTLRDQFRSGDPA